MEKSIDVDVHTIICEKAKLTNERLDVSGVFNLTIANNDNNIPFSVVTTTVVNNSNETNEEFYVYIVLEAHIEGRDRPRYKLIKELPIEIDGEGIEQSLNIFNFKSRKLISAPGIYYFKAYRLERESSLRTIIEQGEKISSMILEVK